MLYAELGKTEQKFLKMKVTVDYLKKYKKLVAQTCNMN